MITSAAAALPRSSSRARLRAAMSSTGTMPMATRGSRRHGTTKVATIRTSASA